jgi:hypothetical protein
VLEVRAMLKDPDERVQGFARTAVGQIEAGRAEKK